MFSKLNSPMKLMFHFLKLKNTLEFMFNKTEMNNMIKLNAQKKISLRFIVEFFSVLGIRIDSDLFVRGS